MFGSIAEDIRRELNYGNRITRLVIFNVAIFIAVNLVRLFYTISSGFSPGLGFQEFLKYLEKTMPPRPVLDDAGVYVWGGHT